MPGGKVVGAALLAGPVAGLELGPAARAGRGHRAHLARPRSELAMGAAAAQQQAAV